MPASESRIPASSSTTRMLCVFMLGSGRYRGRFCDDWKLYDKPRAYGVIFFYANRATMIFNDAAHNRKAKTSPAFLGGEVWQEKFLLEFAGDAMAGVGDGDLNCVTARHQCGGNLNLAHDGTLRRLGSIVDEVGHRALDGLAVGHH